MPSKTIGVCKCFVREIVEVAEERGLASQAVMDTVKEVLWVPELFQEKGEALERRVQQMGLGSGFVE